MVKTVEMKKQELEEQMLGGGGCVACKTNPCSWVPYADIPKILARQEELNSELELVKRSQEAVMTSMVCMSAKNGGSGKMRRTDLFHELTWEKCQLDR